MDLIRNHFEEEAGRTPGASACLDETALAALAEGAPTAEQWFDHARGCHTCSHKMALAKQAFAGAFPEIDVPGSLRRKVISRFGVGRLRAPDRSFVWFGLFLIFMVLSFVWNAYFFQMLVLAVVAAGKWLLATRAKRVFIELAHKEANAERTSGEGGRLRADAHDDPARRPPSL